MAWTACPAAPLTRLSMAETATATPARASSATPTWARLLRATSLTCTLSAAITLTNGSPA